MAREAGNGGRKVPRLSHTGDLWNTNQPANTFASLPMRAPNCLGREALRVPTFVPLLRTSQGPASFQSTKSDRHWREFVTRPGSNDRVLFSRGYCGQNLFPRNSLGRVKDRGAWETALVNGAREFTKLFSGISLKPWTFNDGLNG